MLGDVLGAVKLLHTVVWCGFVACILYLPVAGWLRDFRAALWLTAIVLGECAVLAINGGRCPLTNVAARYTDNRAPNFDIHLPVWIARHNKTLFGGLFLLGECVVVWRWLEG